MVGRLNECLFAVVISVLVTIELPPVFLRLVTLVTFLYLIGVHVRNQTVTMQLFAWLSVPTCHFNLIHHVLLHQN
nr:MAG TPA: hypothetical protein [Microviridae sp.]